MPYADPVERSASNARWRDENRIRFHDAMVRIRLEKQEYLRVEKLKPCQDCGNVSGEVDSRDCGLRHEPWEMDLDHLTGKVANVSDLVGRQASLEKILAELAKCEVVCCWCHVLRTVSRRDGLESSNGQRVA